MGRICMQQLRGLSMNKNKWIRGGIASVLFGAFCGLLWLGAQVATTTTYAQIPTASPGGTLNFLTNGLMFAYNSNSSGTRTWYNLGAPVTPPAAASNWTVTNGGSGGATIADSGGAVVLSTSSNVLAIEAATKAIPSAPYTKIIALDILAARDGTTGTNNVGCGFVLTDGTATTNNIQMFRILNDGTTSFDIQIVHYTNFTFSGGVADYANVNSLFLSQGRIYMKIVNDNTNVSFALGNGITFLPAFFSEAKTSPFTATRYGFACSAQNGGTGRPWAATLVSDN